MSTQLHLSPRPHRSSPPLNAPNVCRYARQGRLLAQADYLRRTNSFELPPHTTESCWPLFIQDFHLNVDLRRICGLDTNWITIPRCMNITNRQQFETNTVLSTCNRSTSGPRCKPCAVALYTLKESLVNGSLTHCQTYPFLYAAASINGLGHKDKGAPVCIFSVGMGITKSNNKHRKTIIIVIVVVTVVVVVVAVIAIGLWYYRRKKLNRNGRTKSNLDEISGSTTLIKFSIDDIKEATTDFAIENIIGRGGFGNVYKGVLPDGSEAVFKRFKNCSAACDASFTHEVEVISSILHVNLVALRGYCIATTPYEGYPRIIVTDLVKNGSLYDHLFGNQSARANLSWPIRRNIAIGVARGLAYLHRGAQPAIIHRDIKASNILLDENFEAKVADFGLAKFAPEGASFLSTRIAGTMGYVAPEYALYGQLTERSDVYSFGVVLLELLSGRKAFLGVGDDQPDILADWAWSLVRNGTPLEVIDDGMAECGSPETMEKYVLVAVLSSHPQLYARPTIDQVLKMLDTDLPVPSIPERPIPLVAGIEDIERSISDSRSDQLSTPRGYQAYTSEMDGWSAANEEVVEEEEEDEKARLSGRR